MRTVQQGEISAGNSKSQLFPVEEEAGIATSMARDNLRKEGREGQEQGQNFRPARLHR